MLYITSKVVLNYTHV